MRQLTWITWMAGTLLTLLIATSAALAGPAGSRLVSPPVLLAKSWVLGYVIFFLAVLLGTLAVLIPAMRKAVRKKSD